MKRFTLWIAALMLILAALACGRATPVPPTAELPTAVPPTAVPPTVPPAQAAVELTLLNNSGIPLCYVYISPTESDEWGKNWLDRNEMVASGSSRVFQLDEEGTYDLLARDCDSNLVAYTMEAELSGSMTWTLDPLQRAPVLVVNDSSHEICYLYISSVESEDWGPDWLTADQSIPSGDTHTFQVPLGTYDLRADDCDGNPLDIQNGITLEADGITWTLEDVAEASLTLENQLDVPVCYVFISPSGNQEWGADWLGENESIPGGSSYTFYLPAGTYDLSARDCEGNVLHELSEQEISGEMTWTIYQK